MSDEKLCPLCMVKGGRGPYCDGKNCAWWCEFQKCCAVAAITAQISDSLHDLALDVRSE